MTLLDRRSALIAAAGLAALPGLAANADARLHKVKKSIKPKLLSMICK